MKRQAKSAERIEDGNEAAYTLGDEGMAFAEATHNFTLLLAEAADAIAAGDDIYLTFGANRARTALVFTLSDGGQKTYAAGHTLLEALGAAAATF